MIQHWAVTSPTAADPDKPHVLLRTTDGVQPELWAPTQNAWVDAPIYFDLIYGDDPDVIPVTDEQAEQYKTDEVGLGHEALDRLLNMQDSWRKVTEPAAETPA